MIETRTVLFNTEAEMDVVDVTKDVADILADASVTDGIVTIFCPGSTGALTTMEYEPGLVKDMQELFEKLAPRDHYYHHEERWHDNNGHSHVRASLIGPSVTIPFRDNANSSSRSWASEQRPRAHVRNHLAQPPAGTLRQGLSPLEKRHRARGHELRRQAVWRLLAAGWECELLAGCQVAFSLVIRDMAVETEQEVALEAVAVKPRKVVEQGPVVEPIGEARHAHELAAELKARPHHSPRQLRGQEPAGEQLGPVTVVRVTPDTVARDLARRVRDASSAAALLLAASRLPPNRSQPSSNRRSPTASQALLWK